MKARKKYRIIEPARFQSVCPVYDRGVGLEVFFLTIIAPLKDQLQDPCKSLSSVFVFTIVFPGFREDHSVSTHFFSLSNSLGNRGRNWHNPMDLVKM